MSVSVLCVIDIYVFSTLFDNRQFYFRYQFVVIRVIKFRHTIKVSQVVGISSSPLSQKVMHMDRIVEDKEYERHENLPNN